MIHISQDTESYSPCESLKCETDTFFLSVAPKMVQHSIICGPKLQQCLCNGTLFSVLSALDNISKDSAKEKENSLRAQAIQEILTSEVTYLHQLELIMEVILDVILRYVLSTVNKHSRCLCMYLIIYPSLGLGCLFRSTKITGK
jgi:hypothetical protein